MTDPARAARLWLALAVATLWLVSVGSGLEDGLVAPGGADVPLPDLSGVLGSGGHRRRRLRVARLGGLWLLVCLITSQPLPVPQHLVPDPWPEIPQRLARPLLQHDDLASLPLEKTAP